MKKYLTLTFGILMMVFLAGCSDDEPAQTTSSEDEKEFTIITYDEAIAQGIPCLGVENYYDRIYPTRYADIELPKDGSEVVLNLESMARVKSMSYMSCEDAWSNIVPFEATEGHRFICSTEKCFVFKPYIASTPYSIEISHESATTLKFKADPNYKFRDGILTVYLARYYGSYVKFDRDDSPIPELLVRLSFEK